MSGSPQQNPHNMLQKSLVNKLVLPGDILGKQSEDENNIIRLGIGLYQDIESGNIVCEKCGYLRHQPKMNRYFVDHYEDRGRYVPKTDDVVIGLVKKVRGEDYLVEIWGTHGLAALNRLSFDGATKRNRPNIKIGNLVYCRVKCSDKFQQTQLTCKSPSGQTRKDWVYTEKQLFGELSGGYLVDLISFGQARKFLDPSNSTIQVLGKYMSFEIAIGLNGKAWVNCKDHKHLIAIVNTLQKTDDFKNPKEVQEFLGKFLRLLERKSDAMDTSEGP